MSLPTELCERVVDFLHADAQTLRACSLVCRVWVPASRFHLFSDVTLSGSRSKGQSWGADTACRRIYVNILSSPHLAAYIQTLTVRENTVTRPSGYRWVCSEITFPPLLKRLSSLQEVEFSYPPPIRTSTKVSWSTLVFKEIADAMAELPLHSLTLRHFSFHTLTQFVRILEACNGLTTLHLDNVDILTESTFWSHSALENLFLYVSSGGNATPPRSPTVTGGNNPDERASPKNSPIENLTLKSESASLFLPVLMHPRSPVDLTDLKRLNATISAGDYAHFYDLLLDTPSLESLEIEIEPSFNYKTHLENKHIINLSHLPYLKSLTISVSLLLGRSDPVPFLLAFLSTIPTHNQLREIFLVFTMDKPPPSLTIQDLDDTLALWQGLDEVLTQEKFEGLRRIRLDFMLDNPIGDESVKALSDELVKQLGGLGKKGRLDFDMIELR